VSREEQIARLQASLREIQEDAGHKESSLQKLERDLHSVEEMKHKTDDNVSVNCKTNCMTFSHKLGTRPFMLF